MATKIKILDTILVNGREYEIRKSPRTDARGASKQSRVYAYGKESKKVTTWTRAKRSNKDSVKAIKQKQEKKTLKEELKPSKPVAKEEKKKIYRTALVLGYTSVAQSVEIRIWIHRNSKSTTEEEAYEWARKLTELFPINPNLAENMQQLSFEDNEEIEKDEMQPDDTENKWWGYMNFNNIHSGSHGTAEYYAQQSGSSFTQSSPFRVIEL